MMRLASSIGFILLYSLRVITSSTNLIRLFIAESILSILLPFLILWPKKNGKYVPLTTENFVESLYIPIQIRYYKDKYIYTVPSAKNENDSIILRLFEPKLDQIKDDA